MPPQPRVVTLAASGRKLNAPPEQYGPKKQLQIKGWLKGVEQTSGAEDVSEQDVESNDQVRLTEPCILPNLTLELLLRWTRK